MYNFLNNMLSDPVFDSLSDQLQGPGAKKG